MSRKHDLLKQPNSLTSAIYNFNRNQKRVFYTLLQSVAGNELNKVKGVYECTIKHSDYAKLFDTANASREISSAFDTFKNKGGANVITVMTPDENVGDDLGMTTLHIVVRSDHKPKSGYSTFQILEETYDLLKSTDSKFTMFLLSHAGKLQNPYAMRLYETISQWKNTTTTKKISCEWMLKHYMMPKSYSLSSNFRNKFLIPAVNEISENTNLIVDYEELKEGERANSVSHILFKWKNKENSKTIVTKEKPIQFEPTEEAAVKTYMAILKKEYLPSKEELDNLKSFMSDLILEGFDFSGDFKKNYSEALAKAE